ncbi:MAG: nucleotidyltransferase domain-containing protein [Desulfuromonadales bacterium]|nr:MAG: nucleotidyltransferase domain-containing protein [Desulfuromonadales bacterium]
MSPLERELEQVIASIRINYDPEKIILFGSLAEGNADESSDIDLFVIKETGSSPWDRSAEIDRYIDHRVPVDILVYTPTEIEDRLALNDFFVRDIIEHGKVLYEKRV